MYQGLLCKVLTVNGKGGAYAADGPRGVPRRLPRQPFEVLTEVVDGHVDPDARGVGGFC